MIFISVAILVSILFICFSVIIQVLRSSQIITKNNLENSRNQIFFLRNDIKTDITGAKLAQIQKSEKLIEELKNKNLKFDGRLETFKSQMDNRDELHQKRQNSVEKKLQILDDKLVKINILMETIDKQIFSSHSEYKSLHFENNKSIKLLKEIIENNVIGLIQKISIKNSAGVQGMRKSIDKKITYLSTSFESFEDQNSTLLNNIKINNNINAKKINKNIIHHLEFFEMEMEKSLKNKFSSSLEIIEDQQSQISSKCDKINDVRSDLQKYSNEHAEHTQSLIKAINNNISSVNNIQNSLSSQKEDIRFLEKNYSTLPQEIKAQFSKDLNKNQGSLIEYLINIQNQISFFEEKNKEDLEKSVLTQSSLIENAVSDINLKLENQSKINRSKLDEILSEDSKNIDRMIKHSDMQNAQLLKTISFEKFDSDIKNLTSGINLFTKNNFNNNIEILQLLKSKSTDEKSPQNDDTIRRINLLEKATKRDLSKLYNQIDALFSIHSTINFNAPRPSMRNWAISPDLANLLVTKILNEKPSFILSAGSGVSDLIIGYCLKQIGSGKLISLEHDKKYFNLSKNNIDKHQLSDFVEVVYAPLKSEKINGKKWLNYNYKLPTKTKIDLLLIDGPPSSTQDLARYPVLNNFKSQLSKNASIILDDGIREDEKEIVEMWLKELKDYKSEYINTEKGTFILSRS